MKGKKTGKLKKISALLLAITMLVQLFMPKTYVALATDSDNYNKSVSQENDMSISGIDSFGTMLADELSDEVEEQNNNNGCNIFEVKMEENTAVVNFETRQDAVLIVGIYTEDGSQMVASGIMDVMEGETNAFVDIEAELPDYYLIKSFLVDTEDYSPLCFSYESSYYTKEMQDLLEKTTDDFEKDKVLNLDEDKTNNFAVYSDEVKLIELNNSINKVVSENEETGTYVIENADTTVVSLKAGDIFAGTKTNGEELIVKVKSIKKDGTTVTITSEDTSLDEVFDYVKIDAEAGLENAEVDNSSCEEGVIYKGMTEWQDEVQTYAFAGEGNVSTGLSYELVEKEVGNDVVKGKVSGSVDLKIEASAKVYLTRSYQYIELKLGYELKIGVEFSGEINGKIPLGYVRLSPIPVLNIDFTPSFVFEAEAKIELNATLKGSIGFAYDGETGGRNISSTPEIEFEVQVEGTIFIGLSLEPKINIISERVASAKLEAKLGAEAKATLALIEGESSTSKHECNKCLDGEIYGKLEIGFEVKALNLEKLTWKTKFETKVHIADFYFSFDKMEFGLDTCPYISYKVTVTVEDKDGNIIEGASINDTYTTDTNGQAVFYVPNGVYELRATKAGYEVGNKQITVKDREKVVTIVMGEEGVEGKIKKVSLAYNHSAALTYGGDLYVWGKNNFGQLGKEDIESTKVPVKIMERVKNVEVNSFYCGAIMENGDLYMWGYNASGQLGNGSTENSSVPIKIMEGVKSISLGNGHGGAVTEEGDLYMWGNNRCGQLGNGSTENSSVPVKIMENIKSVSLGDYHSSAITEEGDLYMWGCNTYGELGNGKWKDINEPVKIMENIKSVSLGLSHSGAVTKEGVLYMWGRNHEGQSGNVYPDESCEPVKLMEGVKSIELGMFHSGAITNEGDLYMWGNGYNGQLGCGIGEWSSKPVKIMEGVKSINLAYRQTGIITEEGELFMCGLNDYGQLGDGTTVNSGTPVNIMHQFETQQTELTDLYLSKTLFKEQIQELSYEELGIGEISEIFNTVEYESLTPDKEYLFYVIKSEEGDILTSDNLLYIAQGKADADGKLTFTYNLAENIENKIEKLSGAGEFDTGEVNTLQGDVNGDGEIDIKDSALIKRYLAGADVELDLASADVNGDGEVNIKDSALIKRKLAGWE